MSVVRFRHLLIGLLLLPFSLRAAVILQYHHVGSRTPASTSVTSEQLKSHLEWLQRNGFKIVPLAELVDLRQQKALDEQQKLVALTLDDALSSFCREGFPILARHKAPFTLFISTEGIERGFASSCSWQELKQMMASGLMTAANHTHTHPHMISNPWNQKADWKALMAEEITTAQQLIEENLGQASRFFAYPFGEYNPKLEQLVSALGFIGFAQKTGAVGNQTSLTSVPRIPASGSYARLETLATKLLSLPMPVTYETSADNPIALSSEENPPQLTLISQTKLNRVSCFNHKGEPLPVTQEESNRWQVQTSEPLPLGRQRYTCTSPGPNGRFYWFSLQWLIEAPGVAPND